MRVGQKQKKIDISVPKLDDFIHKTYINVARKIYKNVYLFELNVPPLQTQKNYRELEIIVQECILNTLRESIPVEAILKAYMDEMIEEDITEEISEKIVETPIQNQSQSQSSSQNQSNSQIPNNRLSFNDVDYVQAENGNIINVNAPKTLDRLDEISNIRAQQRKIDEDEDDDNIKLNISSDSFNLDSFDVHNIEEPPMELLPDLLLDEIEVLD
jgi:hypothetical protein